MKHESCCFAKHDTLNSLKTSFTASGLHFYIQWLFPQLGGLQVRTLFVLSTCGSEPQTQTRQHCTKQLHLQTLLFLSGT